MDLLIAANTVPANSRDVTPASGTPGWATDGDPATGVPATTAPAYHYNAMMAELTGVITAAGLTLDGSDWTQLRQAIAIHVAQRPTGAQAFKANGTFTVPVGVYEIDVEVWAGGPSGGGSVGAAGAGAGGNGSGYARGKFTVTPGQQFAVTIGSGALGVAGASGQAGGATSFGDLISASSGTPGAVGDNALGKASGSVGVGTGGDIQISGSPGQGASELGASYLSGQGGGAYGSSLSAFVTGTSTGAPGIFPGGAGSGSTGDGKAGGPGANGLCVARW